MAAASAFTRYQVVPYERWRSGLGWSQSEHMITIGPTGCGKTTVVRDLLQDRSHVVMLATKIKDPSLDRFVMDGYTRVQKYADAPVWHQKIIVWPRPRGALRMVSAEQTLRFQDALNRIFAEGGWTVAIDELHYLCASLGLEPEIKTFLHQGRSSGLTLVMGMQRPAWVPVVTYSSATHALIWRTPEIADLGRLSSLVQGDVRTLVSNMRSLGKHQFIAVDVRNPDALPVITEYDIKRRIPRIVQGA